MQALGEERASALKQAELQVELLTEKVRVLTDNLYTTDTERSRQINDLQAQLHAAQAQLVQYQALEPDLDRPIVSSAAAGV